MKDGGGKVLIRILTGKRVVESVLFPSANVMRLRTYGNFSVLKK